jgi:hypothetical protein
MKCEAKVLRSPGGNVVQSSERTDLPLPGAEYLAF